MGDMRNACSFLVGKHERNRQLGRTRRIWEGNIRMDLREIGGRVLMGFIRLSIETTGGLF
jgi:hypothetical protein